LVCVGIWNQQGSTRPGPTAVRDWYLESRAYFAVTHSVAEFLFREGVGANGMSEEGDQLSCALGIISFGCRVDSSQQVLDDSASLMSVDLEYLRQPECHWFRDVRGESPIQAEVG